MKFEQWKDIGELAGLAAIIASLIFVGMQLKQSQDIALATQYQARAEATMALAIAHMEANTTPRIPQLRKHVSESISAVDINSYLWLWIQMDNHYYQYKKGFLDEASWQAQLRNMKAIYADCEMRFVYDWRKAGLRDEFTALIASFDDSCPTANEPD